MRELQVVLDMSENRMEVNINGSFMDQMLMLAYAAREIARESGLSTSELLTVICKYVSSKESRGEWK